jgi:hypothetical protein
MGISHDNFVECVIAVPNLNRMKLGRRQFFLLNYEGGKFLTEQKPVYMVCWHLRGLVIEFADLDPDAALARRRHLGRQLFSPDIGSR